MSSIKRYVPRLVMWGEKPIFRAIKVTEQNHKTIKLFAGDQVSFKTIEKKNKSVLVVKELVVAKEAIKNRRRAARNGDYLARQHDGQFLLLSAYNFEKLYQETHIRISEQ